MSATILISTGARLHFGFFAHAGAEPLRAGAANYGGVGLMIDSPGFVLAASGDGPEKSDRGQGKPGVEVIECGMDEVRCNLKNAQASERDPFAGPPVEAWSELGARAAKFISMYRNRCTPEYPPPYCEMELWSAVPSHRGLGAGTQLGMAIAKALSLLADDSDVEPATLARRVGRGVRSAIGIHGFEQGGFLVDAGKECEEHIGRLEARVDVPADWRFLLVSPPGPVAGLSGSAESAALSRLPPTTHELTERLRALALNEMLPALTALDCPRFSEAVYEFGRFVGEYFRPVQGGIYSTALSSKLVDWIRQQGFRGVAQTSWGPTLAVCCVSSESAECLREKIQAEPRWSNCAMRVVSPLNAGATIRLISAPDPA